MGASTHRRLGLAASLLLPLAVACGASVTSVGSLDREEADAGGDDASASADQLASGEGGVPDAAAADAEADACPVSSCGTKVCGRSDCGRVCGTCSASDGCFMGHCTPHASCPGTPCVDENGQSICEGELGARHCSTGPGIQICQCSGAGWISCGACL